MPASKKMSAHSKRQRVFIAGSGVHHTMYFRCEGCWGVNRHSKKCKNKEEQ